MITYSDAIMSLAPNVDFSVNGEEITEWGSEDVSQPSHEDILAEKSRLQTEYDNLEYARDRKLAYPSIEDQLDEIFHNGIDSWKAIIQQVKDDNPKPSE
jgi:hypothetical protein